MKVGAMVMGDLVLFQDEVNPVMSAALDNGLQVTALHNHFFFDEPKVYFMHIGGEGDQEKLARGVRAALDKVNQIRAARPMPAQTFGGSKLPAKSSRGNCACAPHGTKADSPFGRILRRILGSLRRD